MSQKNQQSKETLKSPITELVEAPKDVALLGSSIQPATFQIGENEVQLGEVVNAAFAESGLTAEEWNGLEEDLREQCIAIALSNMMTANAGTVSDKEPSTEVVAPTPTEEPKKEEQAPVPAAAAKEETPSATPAIQEAAQPPVVEEAPAAEQTPEERVLKALQERFPHLKAFDTDTQSVIDMMERYLAFMGPNTVTDEKIGALRQRELYNTMLSALKAPNWQVAVEVVLYYFSTYRKEHFQNRLLMRFSDKLNMNRTELLRFQALQQAFAIGGDPRGRQLVSQQIDFDRLVGLFSDNDIKERLLTIFKI